jgi:hypothetical protein
MWDLQTGMHKRGSVLWLLWHMSCNFLAKSVFLVLLRGLMSYAWHRFIRSFLLKRLCVKKAPFVSSWLCMYLCEDIFLADHIYCKAVSNLDAGSSSMWKGKRRRSSKSSSKEKRPMKRSKTIKSPCGICKQECTNGGVCCDYWSAT